MTKEGSNALANCVGAPADDKERVKEGSESDFPLFGALLGHCDSG